MQPNITLPKHSSRVFCITLSCFVLLFLLAPLSANSLLSLDLKASRKQRSAHFIPLSSAPSGISLLEGRQHTQKPSLAGLSVFQDFGEAFLQERAFKASWVSVEGGFSLPIIQQPEENAIYVTNEPDQITQFSKPAQNGVLGLLAHNYRSGKEFYSLNIGQRIAINYGDGLVRDYQVVSINRFQKLDRASVYSNLVDLETQKELSSTEVYNRFYAGSHHVTFQTCLEREGHLDWGLYFVVAVPVAP